jgi:hypothetical protein
MALDFPVWEVVDAKVAANQGVDKRVAAIALIFKHRLNSEARLGVAAFPRL